MRLPKFTAENSLNWRADYRTRMSEALASGRTGVHPQQRVGSCAERALRRNNECLSRCNSIWRSFRGEANVSVSVCEQRCDSSFASDLWACRYGN
jgi:hypothetical protein